MARVSFTVRNNTAGSAGGSYLRYPTNGASPGLFPPHVNDDTKLRANGLQLPPSSFPTNTFTAVPVTYGAVHLEWTTQISVASLSPSVTSTLLVYSDIGIPQTILSGTVLTDSATTFLYDHTGLQPGTWAYYTLFGHFTTSDSSSDYYEKLAEIEVLVPTDYGSTLRLWMSLPANTRSNDTAMGSFNFSNDIGLVTLNALGYVFDDSDNVQAYGSPVGPLLKYLSIIGFDIDSLRTLIDYIMVSKDPEIANSETLTALADMLGLDLTVDSLGDSRLRMLLDNIGTYRRSKGTLSATTQFVNALTGSGFALNNSTKQFTVQSQRANYITAPQNGNGITTWRVGDITERTTPQPFNTTAFNGGSGNIVLSGSTWSQTGSTSYVARTGTASSATYIREPLKSNLITGTTVEWIARLKPAAWSGVDQVILGHEQFSFFLGASGTLSLSAKLDGVSYGAASASATGFTAGTAHWVRITQNTVTGLQSYFTAPDSPTLPVTWTALGSPQAVPTGTSFGIVNASGGEIGSLVNGTFNPFNGSIYRALVINNGVIVTDFNPAAAAPGSTSVPDLSSGGVWTLHNITVQTDGGVVVVGVVVHLSSDIPVLLGDFVQFSVHSQTPHKLSWARLVTGAGAVVGFGSVVHTINGVDYIEIDVTANANTSTFTNCKLEFFADTYTGPFVGMLYLAEVNHLGDYFDGSTVRGGWLVDSSSISDFRWLGGVNSSISVYAEDYSRTSGLLKSIFTETIPINMEDRYTIISYNGVRGF